MFQRRMRTRNARPYMRLFAVVIKKLICGKSKNLRFLVGFGAKPQKTSFVVQFPAVHGAARQTVAVLTVQNDARHVAAEEKRGAFRH